ncbi:Transferase [Arabidopsis suecica]|uniref:Transferase n=1 Tax=Arabidopsis suecica TaxID=45249 RepID=A0A8T1ZTD3_ARASU|nr:Transferase [Arabidopsis suecica]
MFQAVDAKSFVRTCSRDAISWLPDEVLGKILSSLSTKQAASTSVLSKKWRYIFTLVDNLDFDDSFSNINSFKNFVDQTLALQRDFPIKKFSLKCHIRKDNEWQKVYVGRLISHVVKRGILEIELRIKDRGPYRLPHQLFASKTLVKLSLGLFLGKLPSFVSLPSLKFLYIDAIVVKHEDLLCKLLAGCPVLEELSLLLKCISIMPNTISSPSLKRLSVHYTCRIFNSSLSFDLPNLVYLNYSGFSLCDYPQVNMESLIEAKLDFHPPGVAKEDVMNLVMGIRNVEILHLSPASVDKICYFYDGLPHSPKLENLTIKDFYGYTGHVSMPLNQVKVLHVLGYCGTAEEMKHLKSFLKEFECIELVQVDVKGYTLSLKVAVSDDDFSLISSKELRLETELRPLIPELEISSHSASLLALQVILFPNQGFTIGISTHHVIMDGKTSTKFHNSWAHICKHGTIPQDFDIPTLSDHKVINVPPGLEFKILQLLPYLSGDEDNARTLNYYWENRRSTEIDAKEIDDDLVRVTLELSQENIKKLKERAKNESTRSDLYLSTFVVTYAYVLTCLVKARGGCVDRPEVYEEGTKKMKFGTQVLTVTGSNQYGIYGLDFGWVRPVHTDIMSLYQNDEFLCHRGEMR